MNLRSLLAATALFLATLAPSSVLAQRLDVADAQGKHVGFVIGEDVSGAVRVLTLNKQFKTPFAFFLDRGGLREDLNEWNLYFDGPDCTGTAYISGNEDTLIHASVAYGGIVYASRRQIVQNPPIVSRIRVGESCEAEPDFNNGFGIAVNPVLDISAFTPPFHIRVK